MDSWSAGHLVLMILDSQTENPFFQSPVNESTKRILDIGTGDGSWARDVADRFPSINILGIDLSHPPLGFVPPNCSFEIEDATKEWMWEDRFELIHIRCDYDSSSPCKLLLTASKMDARFLHPKPVARPLRSSLRPPPARRMDRTRGSSLPASSPCFPSISLLLKARDSCCGMPTDLDVRLCAHHPSTLNPTRSKMFCCPSSKRSRPTLATTIVSSLTIHQIEPSVIYRSDDASLPPSSLLADWGEKFERMGAKAGRPFNTYDTMKDSIEAAGFTNIQEKIYKVPIGTWAKNPILKDGGRLNEEQFREGMEGYALYMLTHTGDPEPMTTEEVKVYLARIRSELGERGWHKYIFNRRVVSSPEDRDGDAVG